MTLQQQLIHAMKIAIDVHKEQTDKNEQPYLGHVFRVMNRCHTLQEKIVGALHDVVEDSNVTIHDLQKEGFSPEILQAVQAITHLKTDSYEEYLNNVKKNEIATRVKLNDLCDNMDIRRLDEINEKNVARLNKYLKAYKLLTEKQD